MSIAGLDPGGPVALPAVTAAQMAEVDRIMVEDLGIALVQMMENAGRRRSASCSWPTSPCDRRCTPRSGS